LSYDVAVSGNKKETEEFNFPGKYGYLISVGNYNARKDLRFSRR
jgi:hypothetical protein